MGDAAQQQSGGQAYTLGNNSIMFNGNNCTKDGTSHYPFRSLQFVIGR